MGLAGRGTLFSPLMVNITYWFEQRRGMAVGIVGSGQAIAGAMWPAIFQSGISDYGWRDTALGYGVFVFATMVPMSFVFLRKRPEVQAANTNSSSSTEELPISPRRLTVLLAVAIVGCCTAMSLPLAHLMSHASDIGFSAFDGARLLSTMLICAAISAMFGLGQLVRWLGPIGALILLSTIQAVTLGLFPLAETLTALYVVAAAFGLGYGGVLPSYPIIIREYLSAKGAGAKNGYCRLLRYRWYGTRFRTGWNFVRHDPSPTLPLFTRACCLTQVILSSSLTYSASYRSRSSGAFGRRFGPALRISNRNIELPLRYRCSGSRGSFDPGQCPGWVSCKLLREFSCARLNRFISNALCHDAQLEQLRTMNALAE